MVGCGAVGCFYGAKLCRAGHDVHFLLRSDYEAVSRNGVSVISPEQQFRVFPRPTRTPAEIGPCDLVVIALKTTANHRLADLVPPLVSYDTRLLTLQNGLGNEEILERFGEPARVLGGLCFVCLNRIAPGTVRHLAYGDIVLGQHDGAPDETVRRIADRFSEAGIAVTLTENLAKARWEKLVWNIPFNGLGVAGIAGYENLITGRLVHPPHDKTTLTTDKLLADPRWSRLVRELMMEVIATANVLGFKVAETFADRMIDRTRNMGPYKASTLIDFERGLPIELEQMFLEPLRRANKVGAPVPRLEALCNILTILDQNRPKAPNPEISSAHQPETS